MQYQEGTLCDQKDNEYNKRDIVFLLFDVVFGLLIVLELDFDFVLVFDEIEVHIFDLFSFDDLPKLFEQVHLSCLALHFSHQSTNLGYLLLEVFLFELEEGLEGLFVGGFSDAHEDQQEGVACGAQT